MALDPFIAAMLAKLAASGQPALSAGTPADARNMVGASRAALGPGPAMADVRPVRISTRSGGIAGRLFLPSARPEGLVVYQHGGGWVVGELDDYDTLARQLAFESGAAVLLTEYRLAPEHPFPAGLEDTEDAFLWAADNMAELLGRSVPIVVAGDSAGANLATVALRRLRGRFSAALQVLIYPVTDCRFDSPSYQAHSEGMPLKRADMEWFFGHYAPAGQHASPDISPLRADDLGGMPPALVMTAEHDVLCHEGEAYAEMLTAAGVPVRHRRYPGTTHGFIRLHNLFGSAKAAVSEAAEAIRDAVRAAEGSVPTTGPDRRT
ncbi:MAG: hypothetical protein JWR08_602 [Enterovirga sp.]|nr:hypothetical protein [Enterovirga sp.]